MKINFLTLAVSLVTFASVALATPGEDDAESAGGRVALKIDIPWNQKQAHEVEVTGDFDESEGVEVHSHCEHGQSISRIRDLSLTSTRFHFHDLYLNGAGYTFYIWFKGNDTSFSKARATPVTTFDVVRKARISLTDAASSSSN